MMFRTLSLLPLVAAGQSFDEWCAEHQGLGCNDNGNEKEARKAIFENHKSLVAEVNSKQQDFTLALNKFATMTVDEMPTGADRKLSPPPGPGMPLLGEPEQLTELASDVDWQQQGYVTPVKNQGQCGSCWAFATNGAVEANYAIKKGAGQFVSASEQQLVDCTGSLGNQGCSGGWPYNALKYLQGAGSCSTASYPYKGTDGSCQASSCSLLPLTVTGYQQVQANSESALKNALNQGVVTVTVLADSNFQLYNGGVLQGACSGQINHAVLAVGYSSSFFKIKNSWGSNWGEQGYIKLAAGSNTACVVSEQSTYAVVTAGSAPAPSPSPTPSCADQDANCSYWSQQGYCSQSSQYYTFMTQSCRASCGWCSAVEV